MNNKDKAENARLCAERQKNNEALDELKKEQTRLRKTKEAVALADEREGILDGVHDRLEGRMEKRRGCCPSYHGLSSIPYELGYLDGSTFNANDKRLATRVRKIDEKLNKMAGAK